MKYISYRIKSLVYITHDTFVLQVYQSKPPLCYVAGDYCYIRNPIGNESDISKPFSIASTPTQKEYIEFCIKVYGEWTRQLSTLCPGDDIELSDPQHDTQIASADEMVFLIGGVGIAPVMSMLRYMEATKDTRKVIAIFGNKTEKDIIYSDDLEQMARNNMQLRIIHILSEEPDNTAWVGERGFVTEDLIHTYVDVNTKPLYYIFGNPLFIKTATECLRRLNVASADISVRT